MKKITIYEISLAIIALHESFLLGLVVLAYILLKEREYRHLEMGSAEALRRLQAEWEQKCKQRDDKIKAITDEIKEDDLPDFHEPAETPKHFVNYGNFIIEDFGGWYIVKKPDMTSYPKMFNNIEEAKRVVDQLAPLHQPEPTKRSTIHNIRFVK